jgi:hypothetical membrane protein
MPPFNVGLLLLGVFVILQSMNFRVDAAQRKINLELS